MINRAITWRIYKVVCNLNHKGYVGLTKFSVKVRWERHIYISKRNNFALSNAIQKYKVTNFNIFVLKDRIPSKELAIFWEKFYIRKENTLYPNGYNLTLGGEGVNGCEEVNKKIGSKTKKYFENKDKRELQRNTAKEQWKDPEFRKKMKVGLKKRWIDKKRKLFKRFKK